MCAVYRPSYRHSWVQTVFGIDLDVALSSAHDDSDNHHAQGARRGVDDVYPGHRGLIVANSHVRQKTVIGLARFGMIAPWARDEASSRRTYNARSETVADKPTYRQAWRECHFAIALVEHFYEPDYQTGKPLRHKIRRADGQPMGIGSLWQRWKHPQTGQIVMSFTMLTINADHHPVMRRFHKPGDEKRTPLILPESDFAPWLQADVITARAVIASAQGFDKMPELFSEPDPVKKVANSVQV